MASQREQDKDIQRKRDHLHSRLPKWYEVKSIQDDPEPSEVSAARKTIEKFDTVQAKKRAAREVKFKRMLNEAREAISFRTPEQALVSVKKFEAEFGLAE
jgi:hypothetical protein